MFEQQTVLFYSGEDERIKGSEMYNQEWPNKSWSVCTDFVLI